MYKKSRKDNIYTYWPRTFDLQNETLCPKALWVGGNTQIWGLFCGFVESVGCVPPPLLPMLFWFFALQRISSTCFH